LAVDETKTRSISPFSELKVAEWVENRINDGSLDGLRAAVQLDPDNAVVAAHFGKVLVIHALDKATDADEAKRQRGEADFQTRRALSLAPENEDVEKLRAEVVSLLDLPIK
jgi:hypothetical protein